MSIKHTTLIMALLLSCAFQANAQEPETPGMNTQDRIVKFAESFVGKPYRFGGNNSKGFDCSGFVSFVYKNFDIEVPRNSSAYAGFGKEVPFENRQKGDIILFTGTNYDHSTVGHVGIIISNQRESLRFIHASSSKKNRGVTITDYINSGYPGRYMGIKRP